MALKVVVARLGIEKMKDKQKESIESVARGHRRSFASGKGLHRPTSGGSFGKSMLACSVLMPLWSSDTDLDHSSSNSPDFDRKGSSICLAVDSNAWHIRCNRSRESSQTTQGI